MLKTIEKLIDRNLRDDVRQYACLCLSRKSTETALHHLVLKIEKALNQDEYALGCLIDIDGAFNNMIFKAIRKACLEHGFNYTITTWILRMLKDRIVTSYLNSIKVSVFVSKGCPQGGITPRLLYCLDKDSLLKLDSKLLWNIHLDHIVQRAIASLWQCRRLFGTEPKSIILDLHFYS